MSERKIEHTNLCRWCGKVVHEVTRTSVKPGALSVTYWVHTAGRNPHCQGVHFGVHLAEPTLWKVVGR